MNNKNLSPYIAVALLTVLIGLGFAQFRLPEPLPVDAPDPQFSADRAIDLLEDLAAEPHPAGSNQLADTRISLTNQLEALGMQVEIQSTTGALPQYNAAGHADNIVARLPGSGSSGDVLLIAHYDSVPQGPGAGDNGSGVVTILETLRAVQSELPLENDLIVLFTDAEEYGTIGAQAFTAQHHWMEDAAVVLNIEGTLQGSVVLVETGPENGWFVRSFREASPHSIGYAWLYDLFGMMPNLTDFMPFRQAGSSGGNLFAFNGGSQYHTPRDTIENMDPGSLQQHGEQTLALVRHFGSADLSNTHAPDVIYFNIYGSWMVLYPAAWALPLAVAAGLALLAALLRLRPRISFKQLALGILAGVSFLAAAPLLVLIAWGLICKLYPQYTLYFPAHTYNDGWYAAAFALLSAAITLGLIALWRRKLNWPALFGGALILIAVINLAVSVFAPGFSYLFTWPLLFGVVSLLAYRTVDRQTSYSTTLILCMLLAPSILLWLPVGATLYWSSGLDFLPAVALAVVIPIVLAIPWVEALGRGWRIRIASVLLVAAAVGLIGGGVTSGFDANHPMPLRVQYFLNADTGEASWINPTGYQSGWQSQFISDDSQEVSWSEIFPPFQSAILRSSAPAVELESPRMEILEDSLEDGVRRIRLLLIPGRVSDQLILAIPAGTTLLYAQVEGQPWMIPAEDPLPLDAWQTFYYAVPPQEGIEVELTTTLPGPESLLVAERSVGFETLTGISIEPRPDSIITLGDYVYLSQTFVLDPLSQE